jgi:uncharacterized protein (DUF433 family)
MTIPTDPTDTILAPGIVANPARRHGRPTLAGTRITVEEVLGKLAADWSIEEILDAWPHLARQQILQAIAYATDLVHERAEALVGAPESGDTSAEEDTGGPPA